MAFSSKSPGGAADARLAGLLYALVFVAALAQTALVPLLPGLADHAGLSTAAAAALIAAPGAATFAVALPAGAIADRVGARRVTLGASVLLTVGVLVQGVPGTTWLLAGRMVFGVAYGIVWTTAVAWLAAHDGGAGGDDARRSRRQGAIVTCAASGVAAGPAFGALLADRLGFAAPFLAAGLIAAVVTVALAAVSRGAEPAAAAPERALAGLSRAGRGLAAGALALALSGATNATLQLLVPLQLHRTGLTTASIGLAFSAAAGLYIAISAVVVRLGRRAATRRTNAIAAVLLALALLPAGSSGTAVAVLATMALTVIPRATLSTIAYPLATDEAARAGVGHGVAIGLLNGAWAAAMVAAPFAAGAMSHWVGLRAAWLTTLAVAALAAMWLLADRATQTARATAQP
jgi:MFS transporter, DHA1 family, multidrug resistance protein